MEKIKQALGTLRELLQNAPEDKIVEILKSNIAKAEKKPERYEAVLNSQDVYDVQDNLVILSKILGAKPQDLRYYNIYKQTISKALTTTGSGLGAEFVPQELSPKIDALIRDYATVASIFQEIKMPTNPYLIPVFFDELMGYYRSESVTAAPTDVSDGKTLTDAVTLTAKTLFAWVPLSYELSEDILEPALPLIKEAVARAIARALEEAIVNGDTASTPIDSDLTGTSDPRKAFDGLRKYALSANLATSIDLDLNGAIELRKLRALLGRFGKDTDDLVLIVSPVGYLHLLNTNEVVTVERFGNEATIKTGQLPRIDGIPVVVSDRVREDLNENGKYNGTTKDYTTFILVKKSRFIIGTRGNVSVETDNDILYRRHDIVASMRKAFAPLPTVSADYPFVAVAVGIPNDLSGWGAPPETT